MGPPDHPLIRKLPPFRDLSCSDLIDILAGAQLIELPEGAVACDQGAAASTFFLLVDGRLKVVQVTSEGQQIVAHFVAPGQFFGIAVALGRPDYPGTAVAVTHSLVLSWPAASWGKLAASHPDFAGTALLSVGGYLQEALARLRQVASARVEQRIAHALLRLVQQSESRSERKVEIAFPVTRQDVAEMASTTLHTASRTLHAWEQAGILSGGRRRIVILDSQALIRIAGDA